MGITSANCRSQKLTVLKIPEQYARKLDSAKEGCVRLLVAHAVSDLVLISEQYGNMDSISSHLDLSNIGAIWVQDDT